MVVLDGCFLLFMGKQLVTHLCDFSIQTFVFLDESNLVIFVLLLIFLHLVNSLANMDL